MLWEVGKVYKTRDGENTAIYIGPFHGTINNEVVVDRLIFKLKGKMNCLTYRNLDGTHSMPEWRGKLDIISDEPTDEERELCAQLFDSLRWSASANLVRISGQITEPTKSFLEKFVEIYRAAKGVS